jgi:site-specific DNA recombinase
VDSEVWQRVQALLGRNARTGGVRNQFGALLKGIVRCSPCGCAMVATHTTRKGNRRYRYYVCSGAQKRGWHTCPSKSIPAGEIERFVVEQLRGIGSDPTLVRETLTQACARADEDRKNLLAERRGLERDAGRWNDEVSGLLNEVAKGGNPASLKRLAELQERIRTGDQRGSEINAQLLALEHELVTEDEVRTALSAFAPVWNALAPREQARVVQLLVERVDYDGANGTIAITFHPAGLKVLAVERTTKEQSA